MENRQTVKEKLQQNKADLEKKTIVFVAQNTTVEINIQLSQEINKITYKGEVLDSQLVTEINLAVSQAKSVFEKEMLEIIRSFGISM